jgi:hypothetical protein
MTVNKLFENLETFEYLEMALTKQNFIQEYIKSRENIGITFYHQIQNLFYSPLLSQNVRIQKYKGVTLPVVLYGRETWSLSLYLSLFEETNKEYGCSITTYGGKYFKPKQRENNRRAF